MSRGSAWLYPMLHRPGGSLNGARNSKFAGLPTGLAMPSRVYSRVFVPGSIREQQEFISNPSAPAAGDGETWRTTTYNSATYSFSATSVPHFRVATGATENDGFQMQAVGGQGQSNTLFDLSAISRAWIEGIIRISDTNNNETTTLQQLEMFLGLAPVDTDVFATITDFVGLHKDDGEGSLYVVSSDGSVATMADAPVRSESIALDDSAAADDGTGVVNEFFTIGFQIDYTGTDQALLQPWFRSNSTRLKFGDSMRAVVSLGTEVPDAAMCPTIAFDTGEAVAKNLDIRMIHYGFEYPLG